MDKAGTGSAVGGLTGREDGGGAINEDSFWDTDASGQTSSGGGTGKTTLEMKDVNTFTNESTEGLNSAWDFHNDPNNDTGTEDIWAIAESTNDGYPYIGSPELPHIIMNEGLSNEYKLYIYPKESLDHVWGGHNAGHVGADSFADGGGNTQAIVDEFGEKEPYEGRTDYAAKVTDDLDEYDYSDWFLPARDQLEEIYKALDAGEINKGGFVDIWEDFRSELYWSSTEGNGEVHLVRMSDGDLFTRNKDSAYYVRAVRVDWSVGLNNPADGSTDVSSTPELNVTVTSPSGNDIDVDFYEVTGWDIETAIYDGIEIDTEDTGPEGIHLSADGTIMYVMGYSDEEVYQFSLSTPWDLSTAVFEYSQPNVDANSSDVFVSPDGGNYYELEKADGEIHWMDMDDGDISTVNTGDIKATMPTQSSDPEDIHFSPDGTKLYELSNNNIYEYNLSTAWDISTATYSNVSIATQDGASTGLFIHPNGE